MKTTLLASFMIVTSLAFAQKRITAITNYVYDPNGSLYEIDSSAFLHNSQQNGIPYVKPIFDYDGNVHTYDLRFGGTNVNTSPDQIAFYSGVAHPLNYDLTYTNTLVNGLVMETSSGGFWRTLNEYNAQGNLRKSITENYVSNLWIPIDSTTYTYDALGNQLTRSIYDVATLDALVYTDTAVFLFGTNLLGQYTIYNPSNLGGGLVPIEKTIVAYNGDTIVNEDKFYAIFSSGLEWTFRTNYVYNGGAQPSGYTSHNVQNNTVDPNPSEIVAFQNDALNRHEKTLSTLPNGDTLSLITYFYDQMFVTRARWERYDFTYGLYLEQESFYYYEDAPLGIQQQTEIEVSVYPNPATDALHIVTQEKIESVQLLNMHGQVLIEQNVPDLSISHLSPGNYILVGTTSEGRFAKKIVKH